MPLSVDEYLNLPYRVEVFRETDFDSPGWVARVPDLPGCFTQGDTFEELGEMIEDAMRAWIETALERGIPVPEPRFEQEYSGKFVVRLPKSLHRQLVEEAEREGVSLNQYVNVALAKAVAGNAGAAAREDSSRPIYAPLERRLEAALADEQKDYQV